MATLLFSNPHIMVVENDIAIGCVAPVSVRAGIIDEYEVHVNDNVSMISRKTPLVEIQELIHKMAL